MIALFVLWVGTAVLLLVVAAAVLTVQLGFCVAIRLRTGKWPDLEDLDAC